MISERADGRYLSYLREKDIGYVIAGKESIDIILALEKLKELFGIECLLREGGSVINGAFLRADCVDELSLVTAPLIGESDDKPLFYDSCVKDFEPVKIEMREGSPVLRCKKI
ncbi:MAG: dihydrofolate reductase family protein [Clostridia bacterium]|nr:dihydrofolate reductase family protein [Clostridia bacterium]